MLMSKQEKAIVRRRRKMRRKRLQAMIDKLTDPRNDEVEMPAVKEANYSLPWSA